MRMRSTSRRSSGLGSATGYLGRSSLPKTRAVLYDIWKITDKTAEKRSQRIERQVDKKAIEVARYVLPIATFTAMVHTLSGVVLHRLYRMSNSGDTPLETALIVNQMVDRVKEIDPQFFERIGSGPLDEAMLPEQHILNQQDAGSRSRARDEFDGELGGCTSAASGLHAGCGACSRDIAPSCSRLR